jgi:protein-L-isoaspartate(D-aspartate) O-methyltransferase
MSLGSGWSPAAAQDADPYQQLRDRMVTRQLMARGISDARVLLALGKIPRHLFVPERLAALAYGDHALPIGSGQTISQPYIVALMSEWAEVKAGDKVLEVGTGSGYQAAVLAELTDKVFTIDIRPELVEQAEKVLRSLNYSQIKAKSGDGYLGWPGAAPFDAILVTAAASKVPPALEAQLKEGGRLVIPLGQANRAQTLYRYRKSQGKLVEEKTLAVIFVPMVEPEGK